MTDITHMTMGAYKKQVCNDQGSGLALPEFPTKTKFELKGYIIGMLKDIPFFGKDYEDEFNHIDEVKDNSNYFNVPHVSREIVLLRMLPVTLIGDAKRWLKSLAPGTITTWTNLRKVFIEQYPRPSKISKLNKKIANFHQYDGESLFEAWKCIKAC